MKKLLSLIMALSMITALLVGCGTQNADVQQGDDAEQTYTLKVHLSAPQSDPMYKACEEFKRIIEEKTNGNVTLELYPSSSLGVTQDCLEGLSMRACDVVFESLSNLSTWTELANIEAVPYMYSGVEHFNAVWKGDVGKKIFDDVGAATGLKIMGSGLQGVRVVTSTVPVQSVEDVKGLKLRVPTIDVYLKTWQWLGAAATPLPGSEIFTSLQQKTVEGQENPYTNSANMSLQEVCNYVTETNHVYSMTTFIMDQKFFSSLPADYQAAIEEAAAAAGDVCTELYLESAEEAKQVFVDAGATIYEVDLKEWQDAMDGFVEENYPNLTEYYNMILEADPTK